MSIVVTLLPMTFTIDLTNPTAGAHVKYAIDYKNGKVSGVIGFNETTLITPNVTTAIQSLQKTIEKELNTQLGTRDRFSLEGNVEPESEDDSL